MNQLTTMSLCLLATFGVLILQVNGDDGSDFFRDADIWEKCYSANMEMSKCMHKVVDQLAIREEVDRSSRICYKLLGILSSCKGVYDEFIRCYNTADKRLISSASMVLRSIHSFFCATHFSQGSDYTDWNGPECLASKKTEIKDCISDYLDRLNTTNDVSKTVCLKFVGLESCVTGHVSQCPSPGGINLASVIFTDEKTKIGCKN